MGEGFQKFGAAALAVSACALFVLVLQPAASVQLHSAVSTRPVTYVLPQTVPALQARAMTSVANGVRSPAQWMELPEEIMQAKDTSRQSPLLSLALVPLAAIAGYFAGKRTPKVSLDPMDISAPCPNAYSMLSVDGAAEAEAADAEVTSATGPSVVEKSYAKIIDYVEKKYLKDASEIPDIQIGDTVVVGVRIREGEKERTQDYSGVVICMRNGGLHKAITVRAVLQGVGVERVFPVHAPQVAYIKIVKRAKVRRAKLFYLRDRSGKAARLKQRTDKTLKKTAA